MQRRHCTIGFRPDSLPPQRSAAAGAPPGHYQRPRTIFASPAQRAVPPRPHRRRNHAEARVITCVTSAAGSRRHAAADSPCVRDRLQLHPICRNLQIPDVANGDRAEFFEYPSLHRPARCDCAAGTGSSPRSASLQVDGPPSAHRAARPQLAVRRHQPQSSGGPPSYVLR